MAIEKMSVFYNYVNLILIIINSKCNIVNYKNEIYQRQKKILKSSRLITALWVVVGIAWFWPIYESIGQYQCKSWSILFKLSLDVITIYLYI